MAIAPTRLGGLVLKHAGYDLVHALRNEGLVRDDVSDDDILAAETRALVEQEGLGGLGQEFNSPHERTRVFLEPLLSAKGRMWADPLASLKDDGPVEARPPWWKFWSR